MSDTAHDYQTIKTAAIEGLEDLFVPVTTDGQASPDHSQASTSHGQTTPDQRSSALTIDEAAVILGVTPRTILRRLQKQSLSGFKIAGQFGPEWRVLLLHDDSAPTQASTSHGQTTPDQPLTTPDHINFQIISSENELVSELRRQIDALKTELESKVSEAQREIQAASFRNGYLESQLENQRDQIKLLTDSQHKPGWWARFKKWCAGT